jgi:hypothetical protein
MIGAHAAGFNDHMLRSDNLLSVVHWLVRIVSSGAYRDHQIRVPRTRQVPCVKTLAAGPARLCLSQIFSSKGSYRRKSGFG